MLLELVLSAPRSWSTLEEEFDRESELVRFVAMLAFTEFRDASILDDDTDRFRELVFIVESAPSTLDEESERLSEEV